MGLGARQGLLGETFRVLRIVRSSLLCPDVQDPRDTIPQDSQSKQAFPCHLFECELFLSRPSSLWGPLMFSKNVHGTSAQFWGLSWQHQAHLANSEMLDSFFTL